MDRRQASFPQAPEWKAQGRSGTPAPSYFDPYQPSKATGLHSGCDEANWVMASVKRAAAAIAAILVREGVDYAQSKALFKVARERAGLRAAPEHRGGVDRLTVEEELRFLDQAYSRPGRPHRADAADVAGDRRQSLRAGAASCRGCQPRRARDHHPTGQGRKAPGGADPA